MREFVLVDALALTSGKALLGLVGDGAGPEDAFLISMRQMNELYIAAVDRAQETGDRMWLPVLRNDGDLVVRGSRFTSSPDRMDPQEIVSPKWSS